MALSSAIVLLAVLNSVQSFSNEDPSNTVFARSGVLTPHDMDDPLQIFSQQGSKRAELPGTSSLFTSPHQTYTVNGGTVRSSKRRNTITITPQSERRSIPLFSVLDKLLTDGEKLKLTNLKGGFMRRNMYKLTEIKVKKIGSNFEFQIKGEALHGITFYSITFADASVDIKLNRRQETVIFTFEGSIHVGVVQAQFSISGNLTHAIYTSTIQQASPIELIDQLFAGNTALADELLKILSEQNLREMFSKTLPNIIIKGVQTEARDFQFVIYTDYRFQEQSLDLKLLCFVTRTERHALNVAFMVKINTDASLKKIVESFVNITNFPELKLFEGVNVQALATASLRETIMIADPGINQAIQEVAIGDFSSTIPKGLAFHFSFNLKAKLEECSGMRLQQDFPDRTVMSVTIDSTGVNFLPPKEKMPINHIVTCLFGAADEFFKSEFAKEITEMKFNKIFYNRTDGKLEIDFQIEKPLSWLSNSFITINTLHVIVKRENQSSQVDFDVKFNKTMGETTFSGRIARIGDDHDIQLKVTILPLNKLLQHMAWPGLATLEGSFSQVFEFGIKDFILEAKWNEDSTYRIAGTPYIFGFDRISMEAIVWTRSRQRYFAFGVKFDKVNLNDFIREVTQTNTTTGAWLNSMDIVLVVASSREGLNEAIDTVSNKKKTGTTHRSLLPAGKRYRRTANPAPQRGRRPQRRPRPTRGRQQTPGRQQSSHGTQSPQNPPGSTDADQTSDTKTAEEKEIEKMDFIHSAMKGIEIAQGLTIRAEFKLPTTDEECRGDEVCKYLREKLRNANLVIEGKFQKINSKLQVDLSAELNVNIALTERVFFTNAKIELKIAELNSSIAISATLEYRRQGLDPIKFSGKISASAEKLQLEFTMDNIWRQPFEIQWLGFGRLAITAVFNFKQPSFLLGFGGTLEIGKVESNDKITIQIYFGFNFNLPQNSYIYGNITEITIAKLSDAFDLEISSSKAIRDSGFPEGLVFSYNGGTTEQSIEKFDITVKPGVYLKGKINILGYEVAGEIEFNLGTLKMKLELDPITIGGEYIIIQQDAENAERGPLLDATINRQTGIDLKIKGYIYVVGIGTEVEISVNNTQFFMRIEGQIFNSVTAIVSISATYGSFATADFQFRACLSSDLQQLKQLIADFLSSIKEKAQEIKAQAETVKTNINAQKEAIENGITERLNNAKARRNEAQRKVNDLREAARNRHVNCDERCPIGCIGGLGWNSQCWTVFGYWIGCPRWDSCASEGRGALCLAACHIENAVNSVVSWAEEIGIRVKQGFMQVQDLVLSAVDGVKQFALNLSTKIVEVFQNVMDMIGRIADMASDSIMNGNFLQINHVCLAGGVSAGKSACVALDVDIVFFGSRQRFNKHLCIGKNFLADVSKTTTAEKFPNADKLPEKASQIESELEELKSEEEKLKEKDDEAKAEEAKTEDDVEKEQEEEERRRSTIPGKPYWKKRKDVFKMSMINSTVLSEFDKSAPIMLELPRGDSDQFILEGKEREVAKFFNDQSYKSTCAQTRSVIKKYSEIAKGAHQLAENAQKQRLLYNREKQFYDKQLEDMKKSVLAGEAVKNITSAEMQELHFWYQKAKGKVDYWADDVEELLRRNEGSLMKTYKRQLDNIVTKHKKNDTIAYMRSLIETGESLIRRSGIPGDQADIQTKTLSTVHDKLQDLLEGNKRSVISTKRHLQVINDNLDELASFHKCSS